MATLIDTLIHETWTINDWSIRFILSEKVIKLIGKTARYPVWYQDDATQTVWMDKLTVCFNSIQRCHQTFGWMPQVGDRLLDGDLGLMIQDRSIDGNLQTVTFTLTL